MKMIDREKLTKLLEERKPSTGKLIQVAYCMDEATVEVEEPVHCHECQNMIVRGGQMECPYIKDIEPDDYCSFGIRRAGCGEDVCDL